MQILSYHNVEVPSTSAHSLYTVRTSADLSLRVPVTLMASKGRTSHSFSSLYEFTPEDLPRLRIALPPLRHKGFSGLWRRALALRWLRSRKSLQPVVYISQAKTLRYFARLKSPRRRSFCLILECHAADEPWGDELHAVDGLLFTSASLRETLVQRFPFLSEKPGLVAPHRVRTMPVIPSQMQYEKAPGSPFVLGYVGSVLPWKGLETLAGAMAHLPPSFEIEIIGGADGNPYREELKRKVEEEGFAERVRFIPFVPPGSLKPMVSRMDAFVLPLPAEDAGSAPMKLLDYLMLARPVIASDLGSIREVLEHGKSALLFAPGSAEALAEQAMLLARASAFERSAMVAAGIEALKRFSVDSWLDRVLNWLNEVCPPLREN
jgi:glycosyltransferase involved in cell wall biosynthesis